MSKNILIGNGINIEFGGYDNYSSSSIMKRVVDNIHSKKYQCLADNELSESEIFGILDGLVDVINKIKAGKLSKYADGLFMLMELERIKRTYPETSTVTSVFLEDYFLAAEIFCNMYKETDGEELSEYYRKTLFTFLRQMIVDGIFNNGQINNVHKNFYPKATAFLDSFDYIFTLNYDYNIEKALGNNEKIFHLHGEFDKLAPEYNESSKYYASHVEECQKKIASMMPNLDHIYSNSIMSWYWLDKYGDLIEPDMQNCKEAFSNISGTLEMLGLSPNNDEHLFIMINQNPKIKSVVYYYFNDNEIEELPKHIKKPITFKKVKQLWESLK